MEAHETWSLVSLGDSLQTFEEHPCPFHMGVPPPKKILPPGDGYLSSCTAVFLHRKVVRDFTQVKHSILSSPKSLWNVPLSYLLSQSGVFKVSQWLTLISDTCTCRFCLQNVTHNWTVVDFVVKQKSAISIILFKAIFWPSAICRLILSLDLALP